MDFVSVKVFLFPRARLASHRWIVYNGKYLRSSHSFTCRCVNAMQCSLYSISTKWNRMLSQCYAHRSHGIQWVIILTLMSTDKFANGNGKYEIISVRFMMMVSLCVCVRLFLFLIPFALNTFLLSKDKSHLSPSKHFLLVRFQFNYAL